MASGWRSTLKGEWVRDHVGMVALVRGRGWYAYPFSPGLPRGPYESTEAAMKALDRAVKRDQTPLQPF